MAQAGIYAPEAVIDAEVVVRVNGIVREHLSMDWAGDTTGGLPDQVVSAGTGMKSRTGTIRWAQQGPVEQEPPHPLRRRNGWPPREGDSVVIDATVDTGQGPYMFRRFTGRLGRTTGSLIDGTLTSEITDTLGDALEAPTTIPPKRAVAYSRSYWNAWQALGFAGLATVPAPSGDCIGWVGMQGGHLELIGTLTSRSSGAGIGDSYGLLGFSSTVLVPSTTSRGGKGYLLVVRGFSFGSFRQTEATIEFTGGQQMTLTQDRVAGTVTVASPWGGATVALDWDSPLPVFAVQIDATGTRVWASASTSTLYPITVPSSLGIASVTPGYSTGVGLWRVAPGEGSRIVGSTALLPARVEYSNLESESQPSTRGVENVTARSVVDAWSDATLASVWMDERGQTQVVARDRLVARPVSRTLRVEERVLAGSWSVGDDSVYSRVIVRGLQGLVQRHTAGGFRQVVYQEPSARTFESAEVIERFIEAPPEEEWGPIDLTASRWQGNSAVQGTLPATGTWIHAVVVHDSAGYDEDHWAWDNAPNPSTYDIVIERLGQRTLKVTETVAPGTGVEAVYLKSPERKDNQHPGWIRSAYRDIPSPTIRGEWTSTWTDYTVTGATTGPSWARALEHDVDWFLTPGDAQRVADALAAEVTKPMPTLDGVRVLWDPRRQIGDVEEWIATDTEGKESWRATVLVSGYGESWDGNVPSQSVDVRVISMTDPTTGKTYADLAAAYSTYGSMSGTYQQTYDALPMAL